MSARLNVNIDHVATLREARKTIEPDVVAAAHICENAGAHGITIHLRQDRRHIQDADAKILRENISTYLNLEIAASDEMIKFALDTKPDAVSLVPESPNEVTTQGGLDVAKNLDVVSRACKLLRDGGILVSIFIDPEIAQIEAAAKSGAMQIEICTAHYADLTLNDGKQKDSPVIAAELQKIHAAAKHASKLGLQVAAGHGLTTENVRALAKFSEIEEYNIGHHIISRAIFVGLENAVKQMLVAISNSD
jgi:pyridoxine 5-phosphate synthase